MIQTSIVIGQVWSELECVKQAGQYLFACSFVLEAWFYFLLEKLQHLPTNKKVFSIDLNFSQHPVYFLTLSLYLASANQMDTKIA